MRAQPHRVAAQAQRVLPSGAHADVADHVPEKLAGVEVAAEAIEVVDAFLDLADTIITVRSLIRSGMDHLPVRQPSSQATVITHLSARAPTHSHIAFKSVSGLPARADGIMAAIHRCRVRPVRPAD